ncbi:DNA-binding protein [Alteromonas sediminis]|uniref:DNA-binding protein n=1 Tax=Alteromonas sediminis TaxID=2259342 RepID=A0A3N5ZBI6_9ALTE|nr:helix-turn-helix domain-containing protein [Alteromonas sediminis]RPJ66958.1 DNA-binding protein [Alteromonas sediminis]
MASDNNYLSTKSSAEFLDLAEYTLRASRMAGGKLLGHPPPPHIKIGKTVRYSKIELENWLGKVAGKECEQ